MSVIEELLAKHHNLYNKSVSHPLTNELCQGTIPDYKLFTYLHQDLKFFQIGLNLFGKTLAYCDDPEAAIRLGKQVGFISNDENDYFTNSLKELEDNGDLTKVEKLRKDNLVLPEVHRYIEFLKYLTFQSTSYVEIITFMYVMEKCYLGWAEYNVAKGIPKDLAYKHQEWINLHYGDDFEGWVKFLQSEVERVVKTDEDFNICETAFVKSFQLEINFFESCYSYSE
ncbi:PET18 Protein PET18 [Candida maltosa Xu316]|uniref:Thiaminase-2/PQQC domain-containing protein n=1 Tax=Candida maltosa (strain Xu316) TaxID=1245528 RepID=M3K1Y2_CANMX|nr:hypothetical protein G210_5967 [Candida maltosa Xu316]